MTFNPHISSLTARAHAPTEAEGALSLEADCSNKNSASLRFKVKFPSGQEAPLELTALGGEAFLLSFGNDTRAQASLAAPKQAPQWTPSGTRSTCDSLFFATGPNDVRPGQGGVPAQFGFERATGAVLKTVGEDYNVGNIPLRFPLFRYKGTQGSPNEGLGIAFGLTHGEQLYGAGEDFGPLLKNGRLFDFVNADALGVNGEERYQSTPTFSSSKGWSLTVLSLEPCRVDAGRTRSDVFVVSSSMPHITLLLQFLPCPRARASQLRAILAGQDASEHATPGTFASPGAPSWSLGLWLSRCFYKDQEEVDRVLAASKEHGFPPGVVNLDARCWMRATTRTDFVWDTSRFAPYDSYLPSIRERGFEICLWENPYVSCATETLHTEGVREGFFAKTAQGSPYPLQWVPEGLPGFPKPPDAGLVDFTNPKAREWWKDKHRPFLRAGVKCFKTDFGEEIPSDAHFFDGRNGWELRNAYADLYNACVMEVLREEHGDQGIVWARSGALHAFQAPVKWGGDSQTHWRALRGSLRAALSQAAGGALFWSYDIGGFYGEHPTPLFFLRAFQMGMYFTHARTHGITDREPWRFGANVERLCRTALAARLALLPYLEHVMTRCAERSESGVQPLWMHHPSDPTARYVDDVFYLGDDLIVAPFLDEGATRDVYLPAGRWRDLRTGDNHFLNDGGRWILAHSHTHPHAPVFAREGSAFQACFEKASHLLKGDNGLHHT